MANNHMNRHSTSYVIRELQIKQQWDTTIYFLEIKHELPPPKSGTLTTPDAGEDVEKQELLGISAGHEKWYSYFERQFGSFL